MPPETPRERTVPGSTYRLQFNDAFTLRDALTCVDYLHELGITHIYASPLFEARAGSTHGYDVCSFDRINPALGGNEAFQEFSEKLASLGMGLILDFVPNHMAADVANPWWNDVLKNGRSSPHAHVFDIDWDSNHPELRGKVMIPVLEAGLEQVLLAGKLRVDFIKGEFHLAYYEHRFPLAPASQEELQRALSRSDRTDAPEEICRRWSGHSENADSFQSLRHLLEQQNYSVAWWKLAPQRINYRRFFDVNELAAMRMEDPRVFEAVHRFVGVLIRDGHVHGLRIDHPDGLRDPKEYFANLAALTRQSLGAARGSAFYLLAEKILCDEEALRDDWPIAGTSGYDFLNELNRVFIDQKSEPEFERIYQKVAGCCQTFEEMTQVARVQVLENAFPNDLQNLSARFSRLAEKSGATIPPHHALAAVKAAVATFPVYRTYINGDTVAAEDQHEIKRGLEAASRFAPGVEEPTWAILRRLLLQSPPLAHLNDEMMEFIARFQQLTAPVTAKGIEDTAFYRYHRLISLNEVGGDPAKFGDSVTEFHRRMEERARCWPHAMLATSTHDTKRSEDVRARINVLSEIPAEWDGMVDGWLKLTEFAVSERGWPDLNDRYLFFQTLVGIWPTSRNDSSLAELADRIKAYLLKATREAKTRTSWVEPDTEYEKATSQFVDRVLDPQRSAAFLESVDRFAARIAVPSLVNSLAQTLIKLTAPGVPDVYQGNEIMDFSLVDPDNRRPVDFQRRRKMLNEVRTLVEQGSVSRLFRNSMAERNGDLLKMLVTTIALKERGKQPDLFERGRYIALETTRTRADNVIAFARVDKSDAILVAVPRLIATRCADKVLPIGSEFWENTSVKLPEELLKIATWKHRLSQQASVEISNGAVRAGDLFRDLPIALLTSA